MKPIHRAVLAALSFLPVLAWAQTPVEHPLTALPYTPSLDPSSIDRSVDPCQDFYHYACGGWQKQNPIPPDESAWHVYSKLQNENSSFLWGILEALPPGLANRTPDQQKIGDYFAACMDEDRVEALGAAPLAPDLKAIADLTTRSDLAPLLARLQTESDGAYFFNFSSGQDLRDATQVIGQLDAGGIGLPERDYYFRQDKPTQEQRAAYLRHIEATLRLIGESEEAAHSDAAVVMHIETALAHASLTVVARRDPDRLNHPMNLKQLSRLAPGFDWGRYLDALQVPRDTRINVLEPAFIRAVNHVWETESVEALKTYLRWHLASAESPFLSKAFVTERFNFYAKTLAGAEAERPRWKRCVSLVDGQLGEALGQEYVARAFSPELKAKVVKMTEQIEEAMAADLRHITWMSEPTKLQALKKLHAVVNKIGYPDRWRDYSAYEVRSDDFFGNVTRGFVFETRRQLAKIGKPVDRAEWEMTPPTVNAYYDEQLNTINFPAGVLQPPLYDPKMDAAPNYGDTGGTIGHELTHAFDDEGRKYDGQGNLRPWWTEADAAKFKERAQCVVRQFDGYTALDDLHVNGQLTLGENIADLGGLILAYAAWKTEALEHPDAAAEGFTPAQRFFLGFAQANCSNQRPEMLRLQVQTDPHAPDATRVNGPLSNMPEFREAFACHAGQPLAPAKTCAVW